MPCTKGMTGCAALCGHRANVEGYRAERARQWSELIEFTKGYDTEIADRLRELQENGTPLIDYKTWLKQSARPPEDRDMPIDPTNASLSPLQGPGRGDPSSEQILLATVMEHPEHAHVLRVLHEHEFTQPLHQMVFRGIRALDDQGIEPAASTVENWLRENNVLAPSPEWDSRFYRPTRPGDAVPVLKAGETQWLNRRDLGLRGWHEVAAGGDTAPTAWAESIRDRTILRQTLEAHEWATGKLQEIASNASVCDLPKLTSDVAWTFQEKMEMMPPTYRVATNPPPRSPSNPSKVSYAMTYAQNGAPMKTGASQTTRIALGK